MKCFFQCIACSFFDPSIEGCFTLYLIFITFKSFYNIRLYFSNIKSTIQSNCICKKKILFHPKYIWSFQGCSLATLNAKSVCLFFWDKKKKKGLSGDGSNEDHCLRSHLSSLYICIIWTQLNSVASVTVSVVHIDSNQQLPLQIAVSVNEA